MFMFIQTPQGFAYAANEVEGDEPIRAVHNVGVGNEMYCFFVSHNVVLTPAEVGGMTDEQLTSKILECAGLYMKKTNCRDASHKIITMDYWTKNMGSFYITKEDIEGIRGAEPVDGSPVKFYMDILVVLKADEETAAKEAAEK